MKPINLTITTPTKDLTFTAIIQSNRYLLLCNKTQIGLTFNALGSIEVYLNNATVEELLALDSITPKVA